jgi:hypothetical protein
MGADVRQKLAALLDHHAPPEAVAAYRLSGGPATGFVVLSALETGLSHHPALLLLLCDDGGPPLAGKRWWAGRGFVALTQVMRPTSGEAADTDISTTEVQLLNIDPVQADGLEGAVRPGARLSLAFDAIRRRWCIGVDRGHGDVEWW